MTAPRSAALGGRWRWRWAAPTRSRCHGDAGRRVGDRDGQDGQDWQDWQDGQDGLGRGAGPSGCTRMDVDAS